LMTWPVTIPVGPETWANSNVTVARQKTESKRSMVDMG
jgi:hypothetical protein